MDLKVGDKVIISSRQSRSVGTVEKVTPGGRYRVKNHLYNNDGTERISARDVYYGGGSFITAATEDDIKSIRESIYTKKVLNTLHDLSDITFEQAVQINKILSKEGA